MKQLIILFAFLGFSMGVYSQTNGVSYRLTHSSFNSSKAIAPLVQPPSWPNIGSGVLNPRFEFQSFPPNRERNQTLPFTREEIPPMAFSKGASILHPQSNVVNRVLKAIHIFPIEYSATTFKLTKDIEEYTWDTTFGLPKTITFFDTLTLRATQRDEHTYFKYSAPGLLYQDSLVTTYIYINGMIQDTSNSQQFFHTAGRLDSVLNFVSVASTNEKFVYDRTIYKYTQDGYPIVGEDWMLASPPGSPAVYYLYSGAKFEYERDSSGRVKYATIYGCSSASPQDPITCKVTAYYYYTYPSGCPNAYNPSSFSYSNTSSPTRPTKYDYTVTYTYPSGKECSTNKETPILSNYTKHSSNAPLTRIIQTSSPGFVKSVYFSGPDSAHLAFEKTVKDWDLYDSKVNQVEVLKSSTSTDTVISQRTETYSNRSHNYPRAYITETIYMNASAPDWSLDTCKEICHDPKWIVNDDPDGTWNTLELQYAKYDKNFKFLNYFTFEKYIYLEPITLRVITNVKESSIKGQIKVSPNPISSGQSLRISLPYNFGKSEGIIQTIDGRKISIFTLNGTSENIPLGDLPQGLYILIINGERGHETFRVMVM